MPEHTPVRYVLEIRINSMINEPITQIEAATPFQSFMIGERFIERGFDTSSWHDLPSDGEVFRIIDKAHIVSTIGPFHQHMVILILKATPLAV